MQTKRILVTGGAGYIGSHTVQLLLRQGYDVAVVDNLSQGHRRNVPVNRLYELDLADTEELTALMLRFRPHSVIHFAASASVGESMRDPGLYFRNNVGGSLSLLTAMSAAEVRHIVLSSTCAIYGEPLAVPIPEDSLRRPVNPYGASKAMVEDMLPWFEASHGITSVALRYFNAAGADPSGELGEEHDPETHLIPLLFRSVITGQPLTVYGADYATTDGTCVRDFVHVVDLAAAHVLAVEYLLNGGPSRGFNVGTGIGHTVLEVIRAVQDVTGEKVPYVLGPRRPGDPAILIADPGKIQRELGWKAAYREINTIVRHAWDFTRTRQPRPGGFDSGRESSCKSAVAGHSVR